MKTLFGASLLLALGVLTLLLDVEVRPGAPLRLEIGMVQEAHAILGTRRRSFRRGVVVGANMSQQQQQQQPTYQQQQPTYQQQPPPPAAAPPPPPQPVAGGQPLPLGTVVQSLPPGCTSAPIGGVEYYQCGGNYYRAVFQGNNLVYVTAKP